MAEKTLGCAVPVLPGVGQCAALDCALDAPCLRQP